MTDNVEQTQQHAEADPCRVFVGNLNYQTKETELTEFCTKNVGKVKECKLIFRGPYSMGFAFVTFEDVASAEKAVAALKDIELDGRKLNVEHAAPQGERTSAPRRGRGFFRGGRGGRFRGTRRPSRPRGPASTTVIYVGNLPFAVTDEDLKMYFSNYKIANAHVVTFKATGRSKGFGFVTFESEVEQVKALQEEIEVDGRKLSLRAAYTEEPHAEGEGEEAAAEEN